MAKTFYWYDLETFGKDPKTTRISQFAGIRTDEDLNIIGEPLVEYCQPANDFLPEPEACLITGITPQDAAQKGLIECQLFEKIHHEFSQPNTCVLGYNSLRFDDEFIRFGLYRNFYDPYAREWQGGNSRWDLLDVVRLTRALRPEGIEWPFNEDGSVNNKLENITQLNGIAHESAHDALSDVTATIAVAKLIREKQPKLWSFCYNNRDKKKLAEQLSTTQPEPVIHVSGMYGNDKQSLAIVLPVALHPTNKNGVVVFDLSQPPEQLINSSAEDIQERTFTPKDALPEGVERLNLKTVHLNKCPVIAPLKTLDEASAERLGICKKTVMENAAKLLPHLRNIASNVQDAFNSQQFAPISDPDQSLYSGGFTSHNDKQTMESIRTAKPEALATLPTHFEDMRFNELLFRYRARNYSNTLNHEEQQRWIEHCKERIVDGLSGYLSLTDYQDLLMSLAQEHESSPEKLAILKRLAEYVESL